SDIPNHGVAVQLLLKALTDSGVIKSFQEIDAVGHRVVHGGEYFSDSVLITDEVIQTIENVSELAPLHNPANLTGIRAFQEICRERPIVGAFRAGVQPGRKKSSYIYSFPKNQFTGYGSREDGVHGTSHKFVSERAAVLNGTPIEHLRRITCQIGNGASVTA